MHFIELPEVDKSPLISEIFTIEVTACLEKEEYSNTCATIDLNDNDVFLITVELIDPCLNVQINSYRESTENPLYPDDNP